MVKRFFEWIKSRREAWESICRQCGQCCYEKDVLDNGTVVIKLDSPCRFLDTGTRRCTVYHRRFRTCRDCAKVTILHALFSPYLPAECGYVQRYRRRRARA